MRDVSLLLLKNMGQEIELWCDQAQLDYRNVWKEDSEQPPLAEEILSNRFNNLMITACQQQFLLSKQDAELFLSLMFFPSHQDYQTTWNIFLSQDAEVLKFKIPVGIRNCYVGYIQLELVQNHPDLDRVFFEDNKKELFCSLFELQLSEFALSALNEMPFIKSLMLDNPLSLPSMIMNAFIVEDARVKALAALQERGLFNKPVQDFPAEVDPRILLRIYSQKTNKFGCVIL